MTARYEVETQLLPDGATLYRVTGNETRTYHVEEPDGTRRTFDIEPGQTVTNLYSTTKITGFPDKSEPLMHWSAREAVRSLTQQVRERVPRALVGGSMKTARPHTLLFMAVRDWLMAGEDRSDVAMRAADLNAGFAEPLSGDLVELMLGQATDAAESTLRALDRDIAAMGRHASAEHRREKDRTADIGTRVHRWVELDMKGHVQDVPKDLERPIGAYRRWRQTQGIAGIVALETMIYHPAGFAGTIDAVLRLSDGRVAVVDFKTSAGIYESHVLQIGAYAAGWQNVHGDPVEVGWAVRFGRDDGRMQPVEVRAAEAWRSFRTLIPAYHYYSTINRDARA